MVRFQTFIMLTPRPNNFVLYTYIMSRGEQLEISYEQLWDIQDPLDKMIIRTPRAAEYYGKKSWELLREVGAKALRAAPSKDIAPSVVGCAVGLEIDALIDAGALANRLIETLDARK